MRASTPAERGSRACDRIAAAGVPTLALMNGHAVGGGIDLALACDWRIAAQGAKLRFIHNELGYCPPWGGAQRLSRQRGGHRHPLIGELGVVQVVEGKGCAAHLVTMGNRYGRNKGP